MLHLAQVLNRQYF